MFHLEDSIADWRRQMRAAGIKSPVPLEELEAHLRDDVEQQICSGQGEPEALAVAVQRMGPATALRSEFETAAATSIKPVETMKQKLTRILASLAVMFVAIGLILPAVAKLKEQGNLAKFDIAMLLIGTTALTGSAMFGAYNIFHHRKA